jgi:hypothetical protein
MASLGWIFAGWFIGLDYALRGDVGPSSPAVPTLIVIYVPIAGSALLIGGTFRHRPDRVFATRRTIAGAVACLLIWAVSLVIVVLSS